MSIQELTHFRCRQYEFQTQGGFCCGLSIALATHIIECAEVIKKTLTANHVSAFSEDYIGVVRASGNILHNKTTQGFQDIRQRIFALQTNYTSCPLPVKPLLPGCGVVLLALSVGETYKRTDNCAYLNRTLYPMNHMGVAFYGAGNEIFIFDPNAGGMIIRWNEDPFTPTVIHAVDRALQAMYKRYDRLQGARPPNVVSTETLPEHLWPYGDGL